MEDFLTISKLQKNIERFSLGKIKLTEVQMFMKTEQNGTISQILIIFVL